MIIGYYPTILEENKEITYDYSGCLFPEGVLDSSSIMLFNKADVDKLFYYGLMDEEQNDFMTRLEEFAKEENQKSQENKVSDNNEEVPKNNVVESTMKNNQAPVFTSDGL